MVKKEPNWTIIPIAVFALCFAYFWVRSLTVGGTARLLACCGIAIVSLLLGYLLYVVFVSVVSLFIRTSEPQTRFQGFYHAMVTYVEGLLSSTAGARIHTKGMELLPEGRFLLVSNHRSGFDPLVTGWVLRKRQLAFIVKPSIRALPVVGPFIHKSCFLAIDRENDREALKTILQAARLMKEDVVSIGIYPEGTRNTGDGLLPFRSGAFKIAQKAKTSVVVMAIRGTEQIARRFPWRSTDVWLELCAVLDAETVASSSTVELSELAGAAITKALAAPTF